MTAVNGHTHSSTEIARMIGQTGQKVRQKIDALRLRVSGFSPDGYDLTPEEWQVVFQDYVDGGRLDESKTGLLNQAAERLGFNLIWSQTGLLSRPETINRNTQPEANREAQTAQPAQQPKRQPARKWRLENVLPVLPLPMLGLAASYGVYHFAMQFVPAWVAIAEAAGFELVYIGLSISSRLPDSLRKRSVRVSWSAVGVSVIYNTASAALMLNPDLFKGLTGIWFWVLSVVHGAPLAVLGYLVADLLLHQKK